MNNHQIMKKNGKAFYWASRFLSKKKAEDISILYAFCRFADDLVDIRGKSCLYILEDLEKNKSEKKQVSNFLKMASRRNLSLEPAKILLKTLEADKKGFRVKSEAELLRYCYGVASTVGLMMCDIFGIKERGAYPFAIDLGIAMQLTNIARDVYEDALQNKIYLPESEIENPLKVDDILQSKSLSTILEKREKLLKIADRYYKSANCGMSFLPIRERLAIMIASRLYQGKGHKIRENPVFYLKNRADLSFKGKIYQTLIAISFFCLESISIFQSSRTHDEKLHRDLKYLPSTHFS